MPSGELAQSTALYEAGMCGQLEVVRLLLDAGADPSLAVSTGSTPLMAAAGNAYLEVLRLLLTRGAAVDAVVPLNSCTAFHCACHYNQPECTEALARAGCDMGLKDDRQRHDEAAGGGSRGPHEGGGAAAGGSDGAGAGAG